MRPQRGKIHTSKCAAREGGGAAAPLTLMVERWVKSAVSPDWTVILGWGTFWMLRRYPPRPLPLIAPPWKRPYRRGKAASPFPTSPSPPKIFSLYGKRGHGYPMRTSLGPCGILILLRQRALGNFDGTKDR